MYAVVRLRGSVNVRRGIKDTLKMLRLHKVNHCIFLGENKYSNGMLQKVKDYVAWGEIDRDTFKLILEERGRMIGGKRLKEHSFKEDSDFHSLDEFADALFTGKMNLKDVSYLKPVFRLHPPRKGHNGIKKSFKEGGELGYHGDQINKLLTQMR